MFIDAIACPAIGGRTLYVDAEGKNPQLARSTQRLLKHLSLSPRFILPLPLFITSHKELLATKGSHHHPLHHHHHQNQKVKKKHNEVQNANQNLHQSGDQIRAKARGGAASGRGGRGGDGSSRDGRRPKGLAYQSAKAVGAAESPQINSKGGGGPHLQNRRARADNRAAGTVAREQFWTLQSQLGNILSVLLNTGVLASLLGEDDGSALEEGEVLDADTIPVPTDSCPSEAAFISVPHEVDGSRCEASGEPAPVAARVECEGDAFDLRNLPARFHCCPPGFCPFDRKARAAESVPRPERSWSSLKTYRTGDSDLSEELDNSAPGSAVPRPKVPRSKGKGPRIDAGA
ncbi:hypothetical protein TWF696_002451 [Orbilia brochopaga]|uniref:Uncharacterized protein n=1 Tax=Orbilia brochopaga TaxID=3140254 RepID=A0AAV9U4E7_9PEZI